MDTHISISCKNRKMGRIPSVSLPPVVTCDTSIGCSDICYAKKLCRIYKNTLKSYQRNLDILLNDPEQYWREVEASIMISSYFRFHVGGDIPDKKYLLKMIEIAGRRQNCQVLCFTKKYMIVKEVIDSIGGVNNIPRNLHLILSGWRGTNLYNPYGLPEAHVLYRDGYTTAREDAKKCNGNCTKCAITDDGCWTLKAGEQVVFSQH